MSLYDIQPTFTDQFNAGDASFNDATTVNGGQRFFLSAMDFSLNAPELTIPGGADTTPFDDADCWAYLKIPLSYSRNLFQYQTDGVDVDDINTEDVQFRMFHQETGTYDLSGSTLTFYNSKNIIPSQARTYFKSIPYYGSVNANINGSKVDPDFVRYVSNETFGVSSTDMFDNELDVRLDITVKSAIGYYDKILELVDLGEVYWNDVSSNDPDYYNKNYFPSKLIYRQMLNNVRTRFMDLNTSPSGTKNNLVHLYDDEGHAIVLPDLDDSFNDISYNYGNLWRKLPFMPGDHLYFNMTINPDSSQKTLDGVTTIAPRKYRIRFDIVEDIKIYEIPDSYNTTYELSTQSLSTFPTRFYFGLSFQNTACTFAINEDETKLVVPTDGYDPVHGQIWVYTRANTSASWSSPVDISLLLPETYRWKSGGPNTRWVVASMDETGYRLVVAGYSTPMFLFLWNSSSQSYDYVNYIGVTNGSYFGIRLTSDGSRLVTTVGNNSTQRYFATWNSTNGNYNSLIQTPDTVQRYTSYNLAMTNDGSMIAYGDVNGNGFGYARWDAAINNYGSFVQITALNGVVNSGGWLSPDGNVLFVYNSSSQIRYSTFNSVSNNFTTFQIVSVANLLGHTLLPNRIGTKVFMGSMNNNYKDIVVSDVSYNIVQTLILDPPYIPVEGSFIRVWDSDGFDTDTITEPEYLLPQSGETVEPGV